MLHKPDHNPAPTSHRNLFLLVRKRKQNAVHFVRLGMLIALLLSGGNCFAGVYGGTTIESTGGTISTIGTPSVGSPIDFGTGTSNTFTGDLIIAWGSALEIKGTVIMSPGTTIYVMPPATLILDGATITGTNTTFGSQLYIATNWWKGIEVWGTPSKHQPSISNVESGNYSTLPGSSYYNQGAIWVENSSTIEYSQEGIRAGARAYPGQYGGGLVICQNSTFLNNWAESIYFDTYRPYPYTNYSQVLDNVFEYDGTYDNTHHVDSMRAFIRAYNNVFTPTYPVTTNFALNLFEVENYTSGGTSANFGDNYMGIYTVECAYYTYGNTYDNYVFNDLYACVMNWSTNAIGAAHIFNNEQGINNFYGIVENGSNVSHCYLSQYYGIGGAPVDSLSVGIYVSGSTGFSLEENSPSSTASGYGSRVYGMYANNTGKLGNMINLNDLSYGISEGFSAQGSNSGLLLTCNDFTGVTPYYNIAVTSGGIAPVQGTHEYSAGNKFSHACTYPDASNADFYQYPGAGSLAYYGYGSTELPSCHSSSVDAYTSVHDNSCSVLPNVYGYVVTEISNLESDIAAIPYPGSTQQQEARDFLETKKQYMIASLVGAAMRFDTVSSSPDTLQLQKKTQLAINSIKPIIDPASHYQLINLYISEAQYDSAANYIDTLTADYAGDTEISDVCSYYTLLISGLEANFNPGWISTNTSSLETIAATNTMAAAKAQSLLQYFKDMAMEAVDSTDTLQKIVILYPPTIEPASGGGGAAPEVAAGINIPKSTAVISINAWPDPVTDNLQMEINNGTDNNSTLHVVISDNLGKTVIDQMVASVQGTDFTHAFDMSSFANGMYFLTVTGNESILHRQVIIKQ